MLFSARRQRPVFVVRRAVVLHFLTALRFVVDLRRAVDVPALTTPPPFLYL